MKFCFTETQLINNDFLPHTLNLFRLTAIFKRKQ